MTKKETIQILQSIEDRAINFPNMTECDWVAIAAAKRHLIEEPVNKDLEEACNQLLEAARTSKCETGNPFFSDGDYKLGFKDGARWQKQQMMNDTVEGYIDFYEDGPIIDLNKDDIINLVYKYGLKQDDKIKVIIIKQDN
jgi:hypothetical protein